jgi:hypothetical protein
MTGNIVMADDTSIGISDSDERIEFDGAGDISLLGCNVGIGTSTLNNKFVVLDSGTEVGGGSNASNLTGVFQNSDSAGTDCSVSIASGTTGNARLYFGDSGNVTVGGLDYDNNTNSMSIITNSASRMTILSDGCVSVGTTGSESANEFHVNSYIFTPSGVGVGVASGNNIISTGSMGSGSATLYIGNQTITTSSDERIKENVVDTEIDALGKLNDLRVVDFNWNDPSDISFNNRNARGKWTGLIAQEVIEHIPYVVNAVRDEETLEPMPDAKEYDRKGVATGKDSLWGLEYDKLVPVLIKAVQELSAKVEALENE